MIPDDTKRRRDDPWWIQAVLKLGPMTAVALGLVYWLTQGISHKLDAHIESSTRQEFYMRQMCINTATTETQRAGCIPPRDPR